MAEAIRDKNFIPSLIVLDSDDLTSTSPIVVSGRELTNSHALDVSIVDGAGNQVTSFGGSGGTSATDDAAYTAGSGSGTPAMGFFSTDTVDSGDVGVLAMDASRRLLVSIEADNAGIGGGTQYDEDDAHQSGDTGTMALAVRNDTLAALAGTDGDYSPLQVNASGALYIQEGTALDVSAATVTVDNGGTFAVQEDGDALTALQLIDDIVLTEDAQHSTGAKGVMGLAVRNDTLATLAGTDGDYAPLQVDAEGALYTVEKSLEDSNNSSTSTLTSGSAFTGTGTDVQHYASLVVNVEASHDSGTDGLQFQFSSDNTNWDMVSSFTYVAADGGISYAVPIEARYFRVVYTNGGTGQTHFRLQTILHANPVLPVDGRLSDNVSAEKRGTITKSAIIAQAAGSGDFVPVQATSGGNLKMSLQEASDGMDIGAGNAGTETLRVSVATDDVNLSAIKTAVETLDNAISGSEMQVDVVGALPSGSNTIGDVTVSGDALTALQLIDNIVQAEDAVHGSGDAGVMALAVRQDSQADFGADGDYVPLSIDANGALRVSGGGGGTEYNEDEATPATIVGTATLMERDDALSSVTPIEGDWIGLRGTAEGALWVQDFNSDAILADTANMDTNLGTVAGAVSGSEMQVDVVASLPAGDNNIGNVDIASSVALDVSAATVTVDLGANNDVTIDNSSIVKAEDATHNTGDAGVMSLAVRNDTLAALAGTDGDYAPLQVNATGALYVDVADGGTLETLVDGIETVLGTIDTDTGNIATSTSTIAGAVSGSEMQVDIVADGAGLLTTAAHDAAFGTAGTADTQVRTVQGIASMTPLLVDATGQGDVPVTLDGEAVTVSSISTSVTPGTGASNLGKAEDAAHSTGDVGVMALGVRDTSPAAVSGTDGDYEPLHVNDDGGAWVTPTPSHVGGYSSFSSIDLDESEEQVSATACTVGYMYFWNATAAPLWVQLFNATAASIAPGSDAPDINFPIPANADSDVAGMTVPIPNGGLSFSTALSVAVTTGSGTNSGAPGANEAGAIIFYKN